MFTRLVGDTLRMSFNDLSFDALDTSLVDLQIGEATLNFISLSLMKSPNQHEAVDEENAGNKLTSSFNENALNTSKKPENNYSEQRGLNNSSQNCSVKCNPVFHTSVPSSHKLYHTNLPNPENYESEIMAFLENLNTPIDTQVSISTTPRTPDVEDAIPASRNIVKGLQVNKQPCPQLPPELNEATLQHSKVPATRSVSSHPCTRSTPNVTPEEEIRDSCILFKRPYIERPLELPATSPPSLCHSSGTSLPSIMSWGVGGGEGPCSSNSLLSGAWASSSTCGSEKTEASPYIMHTSHHNERSQSCEENSELNKKFWYFKNYKSTSYPELLNQKNMSETATTQSSESGLKYGNDIKIKYESRHRYRNRINPYPANKSCPVAVSTERRYFEAEALRLKKENIPQILQRKPHLLGQSNKAATSVIPRLEVRFLNTAMCNPIPDPHVKRGSASSLPLHITKSRLLSVKEACVNSPRKVLVHKLVGSSLAFKSHPLFPLLHDLVVAERYYDTAGVHISSLLESLPSSTSDLISIFLRRNPNEANTYRTSNHLSNSTESVIRDVITYAHRCLLEKLKWQGTKETSSAAESAREDDVGKTCFRYLDAVRSSTPVPLLQTLNVNSTQVAKGNSVMYLDQMLQPFSPISP